MEEEISNNQNKFLHLSEEERVAKGTELKAEGNAAFKKGLFAKAMNFYSEAIECVGPKNETSAPFYSNRAMCHLKVESYRYAIDDGEAAIAASPTFAKGYYRQASGYAAIGKLDEAIKCLKTIKVKLKQNTADVRKKLKELRSLKKEKLFFESIYREDEIEKMNPEDLAVESSYTGPTLDNNDAPITAEWAKEAIEWMKNQKKIHKKFVWVILKRISAMLENDPTLVHVTIPDDKEFTVCGDIHGQYYDLLNIWNMNGFPSAENRYLFNGDFVDRGSFSVECMLALYIYKLHDPTCVYLNRGNHEGRNMNKMYGFEGEVKAKYDIGTFDLFAYSFDRLSLCHVLNKKVMVCHGGLFEKDGVTLEDIQGIKRNRDIPEKGIYTDMLWSDPCKAKGRIPSKRGVSIQFGPDVAEKFLDENGLTILVRSHELKEEGYEVEPNGRVITVFSAPKYCDQMTNKGAYIKFKGNEMTPHFVQFEAVPHPNVPAMHYARGSMFR